MLDSPKNICVLLIVSALYQRANAVYSSASAPSFDHDMKVKAVRRLMLSKLMMTKPPNVTREQLDSVSQESLEMYRLAVEMNARRMTNRRFHWEQDCGQYYATKMTAVDLTEINSRACAGKIASKYYRCDASKLPSYTVIKRAVLQLYFSPTTTNGKEIHISVYQLMESCSRKGGYRRVLLDSKLVTVFRRNFIEFDVTSAVRTWAMKRFTYYGMEVEVKTDQCNDVSRLRSSTVYGSSNNTAIPHGQRPILFITSEVSNSAVTPTRGRRQTLDFDYCNSLSKKQTNCCLRDFRLNLKEDLGWNWIVQPKMIRINQCAGECRPSWAEDVNYTQIMNEFRLLNPLGSVAPCCSPKTYEDIEIMYFDGISRRPVMGTLTNMIVTSCVCA